MISTRSKSSRRRVPTSRSQIAFALGACGGQARILMPPAVNTASKELVNWPARSLIKNLTEAARCWQTRQPLPAALEDAALRSGAFQRVLYRPGVAPTGDVVHRDAIDRGMRCR
jgi:hypothetical protein